MRRSARQGSHALGGEPLSEHTLRHQLNRDVEQRHDTERQEPRLRNGARRSAHLAARDERPLDTDEGEQQNARGPQDRRRIGDPLQGQVGRLDEKRPDHDEGQKRHELRYRCELENPGAALDAAHVDRSQKRQHPDDEQPFQPAGDRRAGERRHRSGEQIRHRRRPGQIGEEQQNTGDEADQRPERRLHVGVRPAGRRHPAAGHGDTEDDQTHDDRAHEMSQRSGAADLRDHESRKVENTAADRVVEDPGGELPHAELAHQQPVGVDGLLAGGDCSRHP